MSAPAATPTDTPWPSWYPGWAAALADLYYSGTTCVFLLHGNVHDLIYCRRGDQDDYVSLSDFLATQVFGNWDVVLSHDLAHGLRPLAGQDPARLQKMVAYLGDRAGWPREPEATLLWIDRLLERNLLEPDPKQQKSVGVVFDYAQYLAPAGDPGSLSRGPSTNLVRFLGWAQNPYLKRLNVAFVLVADRLTELNDRLAQSPHVATLEVPLPDRAERERFCAWLGRTQDLGAATDLTPAQLGELSNGLTLSSLRVLLTKGKQPVRRVDLKSFGRHKKALIEQHCQGLLEFVEPSHKLDLIVGQAAAKERLQHDAELVTNGHLDAAPMGYLFCGPVGTGKTFLAECYAGSVGIPCVTLRNFRSKYVGETEGNLEHVLNVLRSLGPVVVIIDEADAALGSREADGDSGTSGRVFSMIARQMGDTRYRGKIVWMLLTSRPDLLPIDLKRQGRAEVHLPLFYPQDEAETKAMFLAMARKNRVELAADALPPFRADRRLSGSDIESVVLAARRAALTAGRPQPTAEDVTRALTEFIPSAQGLELELQVLAAVLECTQLNLLPPEWRARVAEPEGRTRIQERFVAIRQLLRG